MYRIAGAVQQHQQEHIQSFLFKSNLRTVKHPLVFESSSAEVSHVIHR